MEPGLLFLPAMLLVFFFFFIRPQMKQQRELKTLREGLKKGQLVVTNGGIHGKIVHADDNQSWVKLDVGNTQLKVEKDSIVASVGNNDNTGK